MSDSLRGAVPEILRAVVPTFFDQPLVREPKATCDACAMCSHGGESEDPTGDFFRPDVKCCSYHPTLPNYLLGGLLADRTPELEEGRRRVRAKIRARIGVTPEWISMPRKFRVLLDASRAVFGRSDALLCPYFDKAAGGRCTVWRFRESVCSTFYCKHARGAAGKAFWMALKVYLTTAERNLARHAATTVCPDVTEPTQPRNRLTVDDLEDRGPRDADYAGFWGEWVGREEAFYVACHDVVAKLGREGYARLVDDTTEGKERLDKLEAAYAAMTRPKLLPMLVLNPDLTTARLPGGIAVSTYSSYDALCLSDDLLEVLGQLRKGEPVVDALARLKRDHDVDLPEEMLLELQLHEVVVAPKDDGQA